MKVKFRFPALSLLLALAFTVAAHAQAPVARCTLSHEDHYDCDRAGFQARLAKAHTVRIDTDRMDLFGRAEMRKLVASLGKVEAEKEARPDLIFDLRWVDHSGRVDVGPVALALATLSIYDPARGAGNRGLVWAETLDGQGDHPWPGVVLELIQQFRADALKRL